jgi:acetyltransferase-like isoleucine patch superfamily enzyme
MLCFSLGMFFRVINGLLHMPFLAEAQFPLLLGHVIFKDIRSVKFGYKVLIGDDVTIGKTVKIGNRVFIGTRTYIDEKVLISDRVSISRNVSLLTNTHNMDGDNKRDTGFRRAGEIYFVSPLEIGEGSWIGTNVIVLPQVQKIGAYSIIGAGSVVTKNVPDNVIVAGNPARIIRELEPIKFNSEN